MKDFFSAFLKVFFRICKRFQFPRVPSKRRVTVFALSLIFVAVLFVPHFAHAAEAPATNPDFVDRMLLFFADLALMVATLLSKLVIQVIQALLPIMQYNNFTNSPVVSAGWAIMRDTVNMFFVVVLIVIAFGTIFGHSKFQWQQQVPRLLIFAVVINFSKTLAGLMIDFGQVIMLTFANAISQIAAGNFVQLLGFTDIYAVSVNNKTFSDVSTGAGTGPQAADWFFSGVAAVFMMLIVLATMVILLAILVFRIIMLWVLIVLAPLAWFVGGAKDLIQSNAYSQWWERFKCLVAIGPVLTFFLWLTLAVAGAGNIAASSGFNVSAKGELANPGGLLSKIFELDRFLSFVIGIAMLYAGFEAAQQICSSMPGFGQVKGHVKGLLTRARGTVKVGGGLALRGGGLAGGLALRGTRKAGRIAGREIGGRLSSDSVLTRTGQAAFLRRAASGTGSGLAGRTVGRALEKMAGSRTESLRKDVESFGKKYEGDSDARRVSQLQRFATDTPMTEAGKREGQALFSQALGNKDIMKQLSASGADKELWDKFGSGLEKNFAGDPEMMKKINGFKAQNAHITGSLDKVDDVKSVQGLSNGAMTDSKTREHLENLEIRVKGNDNKYTQMKAGDAISQGLLGKEKQDLWNNGKDAQYRRMSQAELNQVDSYDLAQNASDSTLARVADSAVQNNDTNRLETLFQSLLGDIQHGSPEQRFEAVAKIDNISARLGEQFKDSKRIQSALTRLENQKQSALALSSTFSGPSLLPNYGVMPNVGEMQDPAGYIDRAFSNASQDRIDDGRAQTRAHLEDAKQNRDIALNQLNTEKRSGNPIYSQEARVIVEDLSAARQEAARSTAGKKADLQQDIASIDNERQQNLASGNLQANETLLNKRTQIELDIKGLVDNDPKVKQLTEKLNTEYGSAAQVDKFNKQIERTTAALKQFDSIPPRESSETARTDYADPFAEPGWTYKNSDEDTGDTNDNDQRRT